MNETSPSQVGHRNITPDPSWSPQEKWVWEKLVTGEPADFNKAEGYGGQLDPKKPENWPENRKLTSKFLETILLHEPYRGALPRQGVGIIGAWFEEPLVLSNALFIHPFILSISRFDSEVDLTILKTSSSISFSGSVFKSALYMNGLQVDGNLFMHGKAKFTEVDLGSAKIKGQVDMSGSEFGKTLNMDNIKIDGNLSMQQGAEFADVILRLGKIGGQLTMIGSKFNAKLNMNGLQVKESLFMREGAEFAEVDLTGAKIDGQLSMTGSKFNKKLNMDSLQVGQSLLMGEGAEKRAELAEVILRSAKIGSQLNMTLMRKRCEKWTEFAEVNLIGAKIGSQLNMTGSKFNGKLCMESLQVGQHILMDGGAEFLKPVNMIFSNINSSLNISASIFSTFSSLDLTGTKIKGEFSLGLEGHLPQWKDNAKLILRNAEVGAIQDHEDSWPDELELDGFTYSHLGGFSESEKDSMADRDIKWLKSWLEKQKNYSPKPYEQLAKVLREAGHRVKANEILYAGRERERKEAKRLNWLWLGIQNILVGYGYRPRYTFYWFLFFIYVGMLVFSHTEQSLSLSIYGKIVFSLDMLLPIIKLNQWHHDIQTKLVDFARYYFYFQKVMGYVLASMLIAGLSGIIKK